MRKAALLLLLASCGGSKPAEPVAPAVQAAPAPAPPPPVASAKPAPIAPAVSDPPPIPDDKIAGYLAIWKEWFAKENGITPDELDKRVTVKKSESAVRSYSRTYLEVKYDVTTEWASVQGASSELLTRIKARSADPPPAVRFDTWLEASDYAAMKDGKALLTTRLNFGKLRFKKRAEAETTVTSKECKGLTKMNDFQVGIAGDGDLWLINLFQKPNTKETWPCGVDLTKAKGGTLMNFDAGDGGFK